MRILQLTPRMPWPLTDGGAIGIFNITKSLAELGHEITLVTYPLDNLVETNEGVSALSKYAKVEMVSTPLPARWKVLLRSIFKGAYPIERRMMPEMFELLRSVVERNKFDIVHIDHSHMGKYGLWLKGEYGLPIVLREHNFEALIYERFEQTERNFLKRKVAGVHAQRLKREEIHFLKSLDAIAAITDDDAALMRQAAPNANIRVIPAGVDTDFFKPSHSVSEGSNQILWIGSLGWDPNYDAVRFFLSSILPLILERMPEAKFDVVGSQSDRVSKLAQNFGDSVRLLGRVPDVRDYLARSTVLVVPLRIGGGMRLKLLDFFASGKAVVTTSIGVEGIHAVNEIHALIRDAPADVAEGVISLLNEPERRLIMGQESRALVMREHDWSMIAKSFTMLYESTIENRKRMASKGLSGSSISIV